MDIQIHQLIRSRRRTISLMINTEAKLIVRAPHKVSEERILFLLSKKADWIQKKQEFFRNRSKTPKITLSKQEIHAAKERLRDTLNQRVGHFANLAQLSYNQIKISNARTRWGSCSGHTRNLMFNWRLALMPPRILDYIVVHELMHLKQANHSRRFWAEVERMIPDYKQDERWLKEYGHIYRE